MPQYLEQWPEKFYTKRISWSGYLDGNIWELVEGVDFAKGRLASTQSGAHSAVNRANDDLRRLRVEQGQTGDITRDPDRIVRVITRSTTREDGTKVLYVQAVTLADHQAALRQS